MSEWWAEGGAARDEADAKARKAAEAKRQAELGPLPVGRLAVPALLLLGGAAGIVVGLLPAFRRWAWERYVETPALAALYLTSGLAIAAGVGLLRRRLDPQARKAEKAAASKRAAPPGARKFNLD